MTWRHEWKHWINTADWISMRHRLACLMQRDAHSDAHGEYHVRSIYFDNFEGKVLQEKLDGLLHREKYRIRLYNLDPATLRLERKTRRNGMGRKDSVKLTEAQCRMLLAGDTSFVEGTGDPLLLALKCDMDTKLLRAAAVVDYTREAFVLDAGNVRVTFDRDIRSGLAATDVLDVSLPTVPIHQSDLMVLEVKYDAFLPGFVEAAIQTGDRRASAVSKYAMSRQCG